MAVLKAWSEPPYVGCYEEDWGRLRRGFERGRLFLVAAAVALHTAALRAASQSLLTSAVAREDALGRFFWVLGEYKKRFFRGGKKCNF